jgi:hypothetical protein
MDANIARHDPRISEPQIDEVSMAIPPELVVLFRILLKPPPKEHDATSCSVCVAYGIRDLA